MGRRSKGWYPNRFNDRRKQQEQRPIAAAPGSTVLADEYPAPTTVPPLSSSNPSMSTPLPIRSQGATPSASRGSRARSNKPNTNRPRPKENLCMRIRLRDLTVAVARVLLVDGLKYIGISEEFVTRNDIFSIESRKDKKKYIAEGPASTGILHVESSVDITILHSGTDPSKPTTKRALVFRPESSRQPCHDVRVPRNMRYLCEPMIENVYGLNVTTLSDPGDFNIFFGPQQHTYVSGGAARHPYSGHAMLASSIDLPSPPGQHSQPYGVYGPTQAASDSPPTMPSGVGQGNDGMQSTTQWHYDDGQGNYGTQSTYQQPRDYGQGNDVIQSTNQWHYDDGQGNDGMQSTTQWHYDDGQGNDGMQSITQWHYDDGQGNYGMQWSSQWFGDPSFNM